MNHKGNRSLAGGQGSSSVTFEATLAYLSAHPCVCYIGENVDEINKSDGENKWHILESLLQAGYAAEIFTILASEYGARTYLLTCVLFCHR